jgi:hypothetical protein
VVDQEVLAEGLSRREAAIGEKGFDFGEGLQGCARSEARVKGWSDSLRRVSNRASRPGP